MTNTKSESRLYDQAVANARKEWGFPAWQRLGERFQRALIAEEILGIAALQDEDEVPDSRVRSLITDSFLRLQGITP